MCIRDRYIARRKQAGGEAAVKNNGRFGLLSALYACTVLFTAFGLVQSLIEHCIDSSLVIALSIYIGILMLTCIWFNGPETFPFLFLFFASSLFFALFFSSKVMLNGVDAAETTVDTLQIYCEGYFRFSRHAGWYDLAPIDAIMKVFLLNLLGVGNPYDPSVTTLMYSALSVSILTFIFAFVKNFRGNFIRNCALSILLLTINPYSLLIGMSTPPTNFSLVFSMFAVMLASRVIYNISSSAADHASILLFTILTAQAVFAHPMSIMVPVYLLTSSIYLRRSHTNNRSFRYISSLALISIIIFLLKSIYTAVLSGVSSLIDAIIEGLTTFLFGGGPRDISVYLGGPPPPKSTLFSFAAFPSFMAALFFTETIRILKGKKGDRLTVLILSAVLVLGLAAAVTNLVSSHSRYLGRPSIVLGSFQCLIYLICMPARSKWKNALMILLGIMCLTSILSPNAMIEHYNVFTGGRWPREENFILSRFLVDHVDLEYVISVFNRFQKARLNLYFTHDILYYGHPYHHVEVLLTEKFLIPRLINAKSYWDFAGRLFVKYSGYIDLIDTSSESIVFNGWKWTMTWK